MRILPAAGASVRAYLSVVDNSSGDGTFVSDEHVTGRAVFLPGAAAASGSAGTSWGTSLFVANPSPSPMSLEVGYTPNGSDGPARRVTKSLELAAAGR